MNKEELVEQAEIRMRRASKDGIERSHATEIIDMVLDYALSEIDENVVKVIERLKSASS